MYTCRDLKPQLKLTATEVSCPVLGCSKNVARQHRVFSAHEDFLCEKHGIYIGPSTFQYQEPKDNLLWASGEDGALLEAIKSVKREDRMARERSEDALTWNVFRGLERAGLLLPWLSTLAGRVTTSAKVHYWSYDSSAGETWQPLAEARRAFGELANRGSEPDLAIEADEADIWVEAKFGSSNKTKPSDAVGATKRYSQDMAEWFATVCKKDFAHIALEANRYELLRLWLLGSYASEQRGRQFILVNLVRESQEDIEVFAKDAFRQNEGRLVRRATWEDISRSLVGGTDRDRARLLDYMQTKSLGYDSKGRVVKAFKL